ncbi:MAG: acyl-CoA dehydrogenase family protein [Trebonia sp.]
MGVDGDRLPVGRQRGHQAQHGLAPADAAAVELFCTAVTVTSARYDICRLYADARVSRIYGGTSELMKSIIAKSMGVVASARQGNGPLRQRGPS